MTISSVSQSFSLTAVRLNVSAHLVSTATTTPAAGATAESDRVTLSPAATAQADGIGAPVTTAKVPTRAEQRAAALFGTLGGPQRGGAPPATPDPQLGGAPPSGDTPQKVGVPPSTGGAAKKQAA